MSQNTSYSSEKYSPLISPLNFETINTPKRSFSHSSFNTKLSLSKKNIILYKKSKEEKNSISSKKTKSNSIITSTTNSIEDKRRNKIFSNLTSILSKFILNEELLLNSIFIPKMRFELPFLIDTNKSLLENDKCYYYKKLSENIVSFYNDIILENDKIFPFKKKLNSIVLNVITQSLNTILKPYNIINLIVYGSQASGLSLPESDIDLLLIFCDSNNSLDKFISELYKILLTSNKFNNVTSLPKASSPIIKIEYKINSNSEISEVHMDISFHNIFPNKNSIYYTPSLLIVNYIQKSLEYLPQSKNVIIVIKKYLKNLGLNNYYTGGLNSFSIFLMVFAFYKYEIKILGNDLVNNFYIGQFLVQFLDFYSKFNFSEYIININKEIPYIIKDAENSKNNSNNNVNAIILDPFTLNNIACNSFRILEVQKKFDSLKQNLLSNYGKIYKVKNININININKTKYHRRYRYRNYYYFNDNKKRIEFEEYEKEMNYYNNDIVPNFLEMSI